MPKQLTSNAKVITGDSDLVITIGMSLFVTIPATVPADWQHVSFVIRNPRTIIGSPCDLYLITTHQGDTELVWLDHKPGNQQSLSADAFRLTVARDGLTIYLSPELTSVFQVPRANLYYTVLTDIRRDVWERSPLVTGKAKILQLVM